MATPPPTPGPSAIPPTRLANLCTPARARQANSVDGCYGETETARTAVLADLGPAIPEVELDAFFQHAWPALPGEIEADFANIARAAKMCSNDTNDNSAYNNSRWTAFLTNPAKSTKTENSVFEALVKIAVVIAAAADRFSDKRVSMFSNNPNNIPSSKWRDNASRPDGYFILKARNTTEPHWMDIVATGEYKKANDVSDINDVSLQLILAAWPLTT